MNFFANIPQAAEIRPRYNMGCLMDIPTGEYIIGAKGESVLLGGYSYIVSVVGPGNMFKSDLILTPPMTVCARIKPATLGVYDTENSMPVGRLNRIARGVKGMESFDIYEERFKENPKVSFYQSADMLGDVFFDHLREAVAAKRKSRDKISYTMPILDHNLKPIKVMAPTMVVIDSFSAFEISEVQEKVVEKVSIGSKDGLTQYMKTGLAKKSMVSQLTNLTPQGELYVGMTMHLGSMIVMDQYAPKPMSLTFSKNGTKIKGAAETVQYISTLMLEVYNAKPLINSSSDKSPKYPKVEADREVGNDLFEVHAVSTRNKFGPSGVSFYVVVSQAEGIKPHLTEFNYIKEVGKGFGIGGHDRAYYLEMVPDVKMSRTTVREITDTNEKVQRALTITSEMLQMRNCWRNLDEELHCTPKELYDDLIALGYDWNVLLDTRGHWVFEEHAKDEKPYLSTMDLLRMRKGLYHPYWMK